MRSKWPQSRPQNAAQNPRASHCQQPIPHHLIDHRVAYLECGGSPPPFLAEDCSGVSPSGLSSLATRFLSPDSIGTPHPISSDILTLGRMDFRVPARQFGLTNPRKLLSAEIFPQAKLCDLARRLSSQVPCSLPRSPEPAPPTGEYLTKRRRVARLVVRSTSGGDTVSTEAVAARRHAGRHLPAIGWKNTDANNNLALAA